jgi:hypothetical protein
VPGEEALIVLFERFNTTLPDEPEVLDTELGDTVNAVRAVTTADVTASAVAVT